MTNLIQNSWYRIVRHFFLCIIYQNIIERYLRQNWTLQQIIIQLSNKLEIKQNYRSFNKINKNSIFDLAMDNYMMRTPQNNHSTYKNHEFNSTAAEEDCPYCQMKRKFNIGSTGEQKCLQHSININFEQQQQQDEKSKNSSSDYLPPNQLVGTLEEVQNTLDYYWDNLRQISGGNPNHLHQNLQPVLVIIKRIQQKMGRFFFENPIDVSEIKAVPTQVPHRKFFNSASQRLLKSDFSNIFDPDQNSSTQSIKQWVMHFNKILQLRQLPELQEPLSYEEQDLEMRIFKQSMERKFLHFVDQIKVFERKIKDVLSRLIFYMQKSSNNVSDKQIEEDILFIEGQNLMTETRQSELEKMLLAQACSMEHILNKNRSVK